MFKGDSPLHLKPLSVYSHLVCSKQQNNGNSPVYNIQVHISNNESRAQKRRLDSSLDEVCETPLKRQRITRTCSQDLGYHSLDFQSGSQGSTPLQPLLIRKDITPPRSKVDQSVTPVMSTPLSKCKQIHTDRDRESLPSPIPVLKWDREVLSAEIKLCAFLNFEACSSAPFVGSQGTGKGDFSEVFSEVHESKSQSTAPESVVPLKEEEELLSVSQQANPEASSDRGRNEESASDTFESTLPLQVQVKSKVVVPGSTKTICKPVVLSSEDEWERNKRTYVDSVKRHMKEQNGAANGAITELHSLMNTIANRRTGRNDPHWQHPSDLTRRNFRKSRLKGPSVSLDEWQKRNLLVYRRFVNVPDIFRRSPVL
ncbi:S100P-binding protein-like [Pimephales promelas]|uniref:S100P-binding protein-like n=1 Tax=Pimephales promelas TaxID=90988 RepID=UPI001955D7A3|nr:S100P-binding protein-like [Pimephales promelas]